MIRGSGTQYQVRALAVMDLWDLHDMIIEIHVCKWRQQYCVTIVVQVHHVSNYYLAENIVMKSALKHYVPVSVGIQ